MQKLAIALAFVIAVPAAAQFPGIKLDTKKLQKAAQTEGDKAAREAQKKAVTQAREALKADLVDTIALPRGDVKAPTTFATFSAVLAAVEFDKVLKGKGPFTVFAPSDGAFAKISEQDLGLLMADKQKLQAIVTAHIVDGALKAKDIKAGPLKTHGGTEVAVMQHGPRLMVGPAHVVTADIEATNGILHVVDAVIMP